MLIKTTLLVAGIILPIPWSVHLPPPNTIDSSTLDVSGNDRPLHQDQRFYQRVFAHVDAGEWPQAQQLLSLGKQPLLNKYIHWQDMLRPRSGHSFDTIANFMAANPDWPEQRLLQQRAEEAMTLSTDLDRVLAWYQERQPVTTDGYIRLVAALRHGNRLEEATPLAKRTWIERDFGRVQEQGFIDDHPDLLSHEDHWQRLDRLLWEERYYAARRMLGRVNTDQQLLAKARMALRTFHPDVDAIIDQVPSHLQNSPGLLYERIRWRRHLDRHDAAIELLATVKRPLPHGKYWWKEIYALALHTFRDANYPLAYELLANHGQTEPDSLIEAEWWAGFLALRFLGQPALAHQHFQTLAEHASYPSEQARGAFWTGRTLTAMHRPEDAQEWFHRAAQHRETYYGQLAASQLWLTDPLQIPSSAITATTIYHFENHELVRTLRLLEKLDRVDLARPFLIRLGEVLTDSSSLSLVAQLATDLDRLEWAVRAGDRQRHRGIISHDIAFPLLELARHYPSNEAALVHAIIRQESLFDPTARSHAGASGLMQLMPRTARAVAERLAVEYDPERLLSDPAYNIRLGKDYIHHLLERWDGSMVLAIASYNAGPTRVQEWLERLGDPRDREVNTVDWIEMIPYWETRHYVQRVLENMAVYQTRLQGVQVATAELTD